MKVNYYFYKTSNHGRYRKFNWLADLSKAILVEILLRASNSISLLDISLSHPFKTTIRPTSSLLLETAQPIDISNGQER